MTRFQRNHVLSALGAAVAIAIASSCETDARLASVATGQSCMSCHNGSQHDDYSGPGLQDPHPFGDAAGMLCTECHGGNPNGTDKDSSHVPTPPDIGEREDWLQNRTAYFNRLTLTGIDKYADYTVNGVTYTALDYLQFIAPGDLRVTIQGRSCGQCHEGHADTVHKSLLATEAGVFSGAAFAAGIDNKIAANQSLYEDTAADMAFRAVSDPTFAHDPNVVGPVGSLIEYPVHSRRTEAADQMFRNDDYLVAALADDVDANNRLISDSPLAHLYQEQVAFTCGDCHLGSKGANNRAGDFRSSGCTSCHMPYSLSGRSLSRDPNVRKDEPLDPDDLDPPELAHIRSHRIVSTHMVDSDGTQVQGIDDYACAGCHQGSNRTVMQYWGIRLDQNQDLRRGVQYPSQPDSFRTTSGDTRLFDPTVGNNTFNGRNRNQYILEEDYDGDGRDDTPPDVHYDAGMGCIDCHNTYDLHGGDVTTTDGPIHSRQDQAVGITCESCHGTIDAYATTVSGTAWDGVTRQLATDRNGNPIDHVILEPDGHYYMYSKLTGARHYVSQTRDTVVNNGRTNTLTGRALYTQRASYAMGRVDGDPNTGMGPQQTGGVTPNFSHTTNMSCASCHSSWSNTCMGCHLEGEYNGGNNFSNITGERIVFREREADFVYQSPLFFQLGIGPHNKIEQTCPNTIMFFKYRDREGQFTDVYSFADRKNNGKNAAEPFPSMGHNAFMAHSIRGRVDDENEGPRYCVACHLTDEGLADFGVANYNAFRTAMATNDFASLDFNLLQQHFGNNTGNKDNSPLWVHMVAGLGSGLFLFDEDGCPTNPLDDDTERKGCNDQAPSAIFNLANVRFNMDRTVHTTGVSTASNTHPLQTPSPATNLRDGATYQNMAGPLGMDLVRRLTDPATGIVLDSWLDPNAMVQGDAGTWITDPP